LYFQQVHLCRFRYGQLCYGLSGAAERPESPEVARDVFLDNERDDDGLLDLVKGDVEVDEGGGRESGTALETTTWTREDASATAPLAHRHGRLVARVS
jgi:hypothetical protein